MKYIFLILMSISFLFYSHNCNGDKSSNHFTTQIKTIIEKAYANNGLNGTVVVSLKNYPTVIQTAGFQKKDIPLTHGSLFSSGSVGKEFTTVALLVLVEEGKIKVDEPIFKYLPELPLWAKSVTIEHLLTHTSGLPKISWKTNISTADVMAQTVGLETLIFEPGTRYLYSNINVMLRAKIVENVTGKLFEQYLTEQFIKPLKLKDTVQITDISSISKLKNLVEGDFPTAINGVTIYTTPTDLLIWEQALFDGRALAGRSITDFINQHPLSNKLNHISYDFGRFTTSNGELVTVTHDGSNPSHHVVKYTNLSEQFSFVAMSNDGNKETLYLLKNEIETLISSL